MSIVIVGGHDCMNYRYSNISQNRGHEVKVFTQMPPALSKHIGKVDVVILFTSTVSHSMVKSAISEAKRKNIAVLRSHASSASALIELINRMENIVC